MEDSWQQRKCGSVWRSTTPSVSASAPPEWRSLVSNAGHPFYPCVSQDSTSFVLGMRQETTASRASTFSFDNLSCAELGSSLISILSGPSSQCDLQMLSNPNSILTSNKGPTNLTSTTFSARQLSQYLNSHKFNGGGSIYTFSSKPTVSLTCSGSSVPNEMLQAVGINPQKSEPGIQNMTSHFAEHEKLEDSYLPRGAHIAVPVTNRVMEFNNITNTGTSADVCTEPRFSSHQLSSLSSRCPHVFCLGLSGYLLLSNTGLLGIVCSCHGLHMSVSKFSEHSGLSDVNPGRAVRVDSGETITQWRKAFFQRLGARAPEDDSGWDWPEGFSATAGLEKHNAFMPYLSMKSDLPNRFGASGESWNNVSLSKNPYSYQNVIDRQLNTVKQLNSQENSFTGFIHNSCSILNPVPDYKISDCSTLSNFDGKRGPDGTSRAISAFIGSSSKSANTFMSVPDMQNFKAITVGGVNQEKVSSNFELKLRQPPRQSWTLGTSAQPAFESNQANICVVPQKSLFPEQLITSDSRITEESRPVHFADSMSNASVKKEKSLLDLVEFACGAHSATGYSYSEQFKGEMPRASAFPMLYSHFKGPSEENSYSKSSYNAFNGSHTLSRELPCESLIIKSEKSKLPCIRGDVIEREHDRYFLGNLGHGKNNKWLSNMSTNLRCTPEFKYGQHTEFNENQATFKGEMRGIGHKNCSALLDKSHFMCLDCHQQGFNSSKKTSSVAHNGDFDHVFLTPTDSRTIVSSPASSVIQTQTQMLSSKEGIDDKANTLNENLRLFASQNMFEFSTQDRGIASLATIQEQVILRDPCEKISTLASLASKEQSFELNFANVQNNSSVATSSHFSSTSHPTGKDNETMTSATALSQGRFLVKDSEAQCQLLPNHHSIDWPSKRKSSLGGEESKAMPIEQGKCFQRVLSNPVILGKCNCVVQTNISASMKKNLLSSNLDKNYNFAEKTTSLGENTMKKVESHFFQWRDVPRKVMGTCTSTCKEKSSGVLNGKDNIEGSQSADAWADTPRCFRRSDEDPVSLKEPAISNISSGGSVPVITQMSITIPNKQLPTADAGDAHCASNVVVDEGSRIYRCWSSDDSIGSERRAELSAFTSKINLLDKGPPEEFAQKPSRSLIDELRIIDSLLKKHKNKNASFSIQENFNNIQKLGKASNKVIGKQTLRWKKLNSTFPSSALSSTSCGCPVCVCGAAFYSQLCKDKEAPFRCDHQSSNDCTCCIEPNFRRRRFGNPSSEIPTQKRDCDNICFHETKNFDTEINQLKFDNDDSSGTPEESRRKRLKVGTAAPIIKQMIHEPHCAVCDTTAKPRTLGCSKTSDLHESFCKQMIKPTVWGKYGVISNGNRSKPIKIVRLRNICDTKRKHCSTGKEKTKITQIENLKNGIRGRDQCFNKSSNVKKVASCYPDNFAASKYCEGCHELSGALDPCYLMEQTEKGYFNGGDASVSLPYSLRKRNYGCLGKNGNVTHSSQTRKKRKCKEIRKRSIYELTIKGKDSNYISFSEKSNSLLATDSRDVGELEENAKDGGGNTSEINDKNRSKDCQLQYQPGQDLDGVCCVCGSCNNDESNCLLECYGCSIKVHQACYGIYKVPKAHWYCRPCRKNSKNIVCVLCGYGGGAMTQALRWHNIVKSLLQAWNVDVDFKPRSSSVAKLEESNTLAFSNYKLKGDTFPMNPLPQMESSFVAVSDMYISKHFNVGNSSPCHSMVDNSITAGVHDSTVKQWVHMVCGLWTPGTRCPNVDTMSAFDVSGASHYKDVDMIETHLSEHRALYLMDLYPTPLYLKQSERHNSIKHKVCSLCNRPGGCCIQCRVIYCSGRFHPWCAHQKGLLQSEVEGFENKSIGFYGRCMLHASYQQCDSTSNLIDTENIHLVKNDSICARTEGYKGRKQEGVRYNPRADRTGGCLVPQEQLNAWLHINGQKSCTKGLLRLPMKDSEYDYRKEYARYKQSKGWKGLVVYKSGIHALGLYTSQFISQGAMVVEYVGEVVGLRVADKRENEYLSGKKLQYKSACYFFRIDKEHIIDATRKGGIARFVNHSCLPNCVARVISVRNEKKVVFFAERDIYPGEEVTYDYHFNHEDEGKKLPCYCDSKNCRRYLN